MPHPNGDRGLYGRAIRRPLRQFTNRRAVTQFPKPRQIRYQRTMILSRRAATGIGFCAVLLWSLLAFFTAASGTMPPFQLLSVSFGIGGLAGVALWIVRPNAARALRQPWPVYLLGVGGLFGYHAAYFIALRS